VTVAVAYDERFLEHDHAGHPENAGRLGAIVAALEASGQFEALPRLETRPARTEEIQLAHESGIISEVQREVARGGGWIDADTYVAPSSWDVAVLAAGATIEAAERVLAGVHNAAFCLTRPPGHHATGSRAMGFCLLNNVAIAARVLQKRHEVERIAIVDIDVHHGNGTQDIFWTDPGVLYLSTHQYPYYPGTGHWSERGAGEGEGTTVNVPLPAYCDDATFMDTHDRLFGPLLERYDPEFIFVSAGFDSHEADPLAMENLSSSGYVALAGRIKRWADDLCNGRLVFVLEGGYDYTALGECVSGVLRILEGDTPPEPRPGDIDVRVAELVDKLREMNGIAKGS
jgi:acetoin utilization deacetylase AcuC-like enzyme